MTTEAQINLTEINAAISAMRPVAPRMAIYKVEKGETLIPIVGILCGKRPQVYPDGRRGENFIVSTTVPTLLWSVENKAFFLAPKGTIAKVEARPGLSDLDNYLPQGEQVCEVAIQPAGKKKTRNGHSMWKFDLHAKTMKVSDVTVPLPALGLAQAAPELEDESHDEIPF